jgi:hypothetical protein
MRAPASINPPQTSNGYYACMSILLIAQGVVEVGRARGRGGRRGLNSRRRRRSSSGFPVFRFRPPCPRSLVLARCCRGHTAGPQRNSNARTPRTQPGNDSTYGSDAIALEHIRVGSEPSGRVVVAAVVHIVVAAFSVVVVVVAVGRRRRRRRRRGSTRVQEEEESTGQGSNGPRVNRPRVWIGEEC